MTDTTTPTEEEPAPPRGSGHRRRPPLAEIDSWELWQAWKRGDRHTALPWIGLLVSFCVVLAGMYSFFFFSTRAGGDTLEQIALTLILVGFMTALWRRISPRRDFALLVVALMLAVSGSAFLLWLVAYRLSNWNAWVAIGGTLALGLVGLLMGLPSLNAIARGQSSNEQ